MNNLAICVLEMHWSGTTALAGLMGVLGVSLLPANVVQDAKGFWEHTNILEIHEHLQPA